MSAVATIVEVDAKRRQPIGDPITVDFNPQSLQISHAATGPSSTQGSKTSAKETTAVAAQQTGYTTSLSTELVFDTSRVGSDVRNKTLRLVALARPRSTGSAEGRMVRLAWGSFLFVGQITSLGETIDLFSEDGVPLRATMSLSMQGLAERDARPAAGSAAAGGGLAGAASVGVSLGASGSVGISGGASAAVGTTPLTVAAGGDTVQSIAAAAGVSWKAVAAANGIDNPRRVPPGTVIDLRKGT